MRIPKFLPAVAYIVVLASPGAPPLAHAAASPTPLPDAWLGDWKGVLDAGSQKLRLVIHISRHPDGSLAGTLDDPDQGSTGMPIDSLWTSEDTLRAMILHGSARYVGALDAGSNRIRGLWSQSGLSFPLDLGRDAPDARERPQDPVPPFPYTAEDTTVTDLSANVQLACTVTTPPGQGPFPAVLMITGSGPQDRNESMVGHRPFLVLADHLTRHGFVVMRCDDRGTGASTGVFDGATTADFVADARAELASLRSRTDVDKRRVGLIGHSEGALIAPWIAASDPNVAFIVMLAGPGIPGDSLTVLQVEAVLRASGASDSAIAEQCTFQRQLLARVTAGGDSSAMARDLGETLATHLRAQPGVDSAAVGGLVAAGVQKVLSPWYRAFIQHDPRPDLRRTRCPVLAMNGSLDVQMPPAQNLRAIAQALEAGGNSDVRTIEMPGLNHLFQTAKTGLMAEYGAIDETFAPTALDTLTAWLVAHSRARRPVRSGAARSAAGRTRPR